MTIQKKLTVASIILVTAGTALVAPVGISIFEQRHAAALSPVVSLSTVEQVPSTIQAETVQGVPRSVAVPSLGISANVEDGYYDAESGQWTLSEGSAFFATPTLPVNSERGNTLIYGHNSQKIFGKLMNIQPGSEVIVTTDNGYVFTYLYQSTEAFNPTDTSSLNYEGAPRLTLQTCSGLWNQTRQMFYFELKDYHKG